MVNLEREPLRGEVEVDETWIGGTQAGLRGSQQLKGRMAALALAAEEKGGRATGRARMAVIPDFKSQTLIAFLKQNVAPGSTGHTDGLKSFNGFTKLGSNTYLAVNPCKSSCAEGPSPWCHWQTAPLATCSNG